MAARSKSSFMLVFCSRQIPAKANKLILSYLICHSLSVITLSLSDNQSLICHSLSVISLSLSSSGIHPLICHSPTHSVVPAHSHAQSLNALVLSHSSSTVLFHSVIYLLTYITHLATQLKQLLRLCLFNAVQIAQVAQSMLFIWARQLV